MTFRLASGMMAKKCKLGNIDWDITFFQVAVKPLVTALDTVGRKNLILDFPESLTEQLKQVYSFFKFTVLGWLLVTSRILNDFWNISPPNVLFTIIIKFRYERYLIIGVRKGGGGPLSPTPWPTQKSLFWGFFEKNNFFSRSPISPTISKNW